MRHHLLAAVLIAGGLAVGGTAQAQYVTGPVGGFQSSGVVYSGNPFGRSGLTYGSYHGSRVTYATGAYYGSRVSYTSGQYYGTGFYTPGLYQPMTGYTMFPGYSGVSGYGRGYAEPFNVRYGVGQSFGLHPFVNMPFGGRRR